MIILVEYYYGKINLLGTYDSVEAAHSDMELYLDDLRDCVRYEFVKGETYDVTDNGAWYSSEKGKYEYVWQIVEIGEYQPYNFINDKYKADFPVPVGLQEIIDKAERADRMNNLGTYLAYADDIDVIAKNCCAVGSLTEKQWDTLCYRYVQ
jgi:hypothetical protein